jgi:hypothetical protein
VDEVRKKYNPNQTSLKIDSPRRTRTQPLVILAIAVMPAKAINDFLSKMRTWAQKMKEQTNHPARGSPPKAFIP